MPLMSCPACGRQISTEAEACPQCGHPNRSRRFAADYERPADFDRPDFDRPDHDRPDQDRRDLSGPTCYACPRQATTRCQACNALSCAIHLQSIYVSHGRGGAYELRCESCHSSAVAWKIFGFVIFAIVALIMLSCFLSASLR